MKNAYQSSRCALLFILILLSVQLLAQKSSSTDTSIEDKVVVFSQKTIGKFSMKTYRFTEQSSQKTISTDSLIREYDLIKKDEKYYAQGFLKVNSRFCESEFKNRGGIIRSRGGNILTCNVPVDQIDQLSLCEGVDYFQMSERVSPLLDQARQVTFLDKVQQGIQLDRPYKGKGVIIGIIDMGFTCGHPTFYTSDGKNCRIKRVWKQFPNRVPPKGFDYGDEKVDIADILQINEPTYHATHVAGIAGGSGWGSSYAGCAPESEFVFVSIGGRDVEIADAVSYIQRYAKEEQKPCVINLSLGTLDGAKDGTSLLDQFFDSQVGKGLIIVGAAGNEGETQPSFQKTFTAQDTIALATINSINRMQVWGDDEFDLIVHCFDPNSKTFLSSTPIVNPQISRVKYQLLNKNEVNIGVVDVGLLENQPGRGDVILLSGEKNKNFSYNFVLEFRGKSGSVNAYSSMNNFLSLGNDSLFLDGNNAFTIRDIGGTGKNVITVGAYTSRNSWNLLTGGWVNKYETIGEIAPFSSRGPTFDGRMKPDIVAPGSTLISAISQDQPQRFVTSVTYNQNEWYYGIARGTSMAAPMVTGIIATWLEANPTLTPDDIKEIFDRTAIRDEFTGDIGSGNNTWGRGKIDAYEGLKAALDMVPSSIQEQRLSNIRVQIRGDRLNLWGVAEQQYFNLYNLNGVIVKKGLFDGSSIDLKGLGKGMYLLRIGSSIAKFIR